MEDNHPSTVKPPSSADALAARREARRKRILENSSNRLTKITGRDHSEPPAENFTVTTPEIIYPDPEVERDVYQRPEEIPNIHSPNGDIFSLLNTLKQAQGNGEIRNGASPATEETRLVKFLRSKIHIAIAAIAIYLLFATEQDYLIGGNVFLPLLAWELIEMLILKTYEPKPSVLDVLFLLGGISKRYSQMLLKLTQTVTKVLRDVAFFVFFFVTAHLVWSRLVLGIELSYVLGYDKLELESTGSS